MMFRSNKAKTSHILIPLILLAMLCALPLVAKSNYLISVAVSCCTFACLGTAWNIIGGYGSQISWCHASFVAIGAYTSYLMFAHFQVSPWVSMLLGAVISALFAFFIGYVSFRLRGPFFSLCTIAFAEITRCILLYWKDLTKGANGLVVTYKGANLRNLQFTNDIPFFYLMLLLLIVCLFISWRIKESKQGHYLRAIKSDEDAAESLGINTSNIKLVAFVISAALTSIIGTIYAFFLTYIDPTSMAGLDLSIKIGSMSIVGGIGTLWGPVIGAFVLVTLTEIANILLGTSGSGILLYGLALIIVTIFRPDGIISFFTKNNAKTSLWNKLVAQLKARNGG